MSCEKPGLIQAFHDSGDIRYLNDLLEKYKYTNDEVSEVINVYEPYNDGIIPEVETIILLLHYYPNATVTDATMNAIKNTFPRVLDTINKLRGKSEC